MEAELKTRVQQVLAEQVGPALAIDGASIEVVNVSGGEVQVRLGGACSACPSSLMTIIMGIEQELRKHLPEVQYLEVP